eukprot:TRINITY_DN3212_c0_g2_i1.p1 TRINITY_DN3212_c0_g2~~TRINITY_DN3212_c0_g2_i1.p1  ORF type:complete len:821 (+),score=153.89 TRINITY_DN3212_c0_g2_i1:54-2465(+)
MGCLRCFTKVKSFHIKIVLLDKQELIQEIQEKTTGQDLMDNVFKYLNLMETAYFGLRYQDNKNQTHWLEPAKKVSHQIRGVAPITLYMGVKFYAADPCRLVEEITRYQFVLQIKADILQGRLPLNMDLSIELAALALQSELGDFDPSRHSPGYSSEFRFISNQTEQVEGDIEAVHRKMAGLRPSEAEMAYLEKVKWLEMYGVDLHPVIGEDNIEYFLGLTPSGIIALRNKAKVGNYFLPRITKIYFKGIYFMLRVRDKNNDEKTYGFETPSRSACKHLWKCCVEHHAFFRLVQVSPSGMFSLGSRFRYSGRTEKEVLQQASSIRRQPPQFTRRPSQRYSRRSNPEVSTYRGHAALQQQQYAQQGYPPPHLSSHSTVPQKVLYAPPHHQFSPIQQHNSTSLHQDTPLSRHQNISPQHQQLSQGNASGNGDVRSYVNSLPRISRNPKLQNRNLSAQSLQWLETKGLYGYQRERRNSVPDQSLLSQFGSQRQKPRKSTSVSSCHGQSDNESDASGVSWSSKSRHRQESGDNGSRRRGRRKRQGSYKLIEPEDQPQMVNHQQGMERPSRKSVYSPRGNQMVQEATVVRRSGYVNSGAETETETLFNSSSNLRKNRRRHRSRSRSPGDSRNRISNELIKHLEFQLVEPNMEMQKGEIPFTNVETNNARTYGNHYPRNRIHQATIVSPSTTTTTTRGEDKRVMNSTAEAFLMASSPSSNSWPTSAAAATGISGGGVASTNELKLNNKQHNERNNNNNNNGSSSWLHKPMPAGTPNSNLLYSKNSEGVIRSTSRSSPARIKIGDEMSTEL